MLCTFHDALVLNLKKIISFCGVPNSRNVLILQIFLKHATKPNAGNTSAGFPWVKRPQILLNLTWLCTKASQTFSGTLFGPGSAPKPPNPDLLRNLLLNLTWLCTKAIQAQTFSGTFFGTLYLALHQSLPGPDLLNLFGTLLNLTWLCTKASQTFSGTFSGTLLILRNLFRNPVEPDLALHQSLPDLLRNPLRNPVEPSPEPCWTERESLCGPHPRSSPELQGWGSGPPVRLVLHPNIEPGSDAWGMRFTH